MEEDILSYLPTVMFRGTSVSMQLGFPIGIPLRGIARNCSRIARKSAELRGNYRVRNCGPCNCKKNPLPLETLLPTNQPASLSRFKRPPPGGYSSQLW